MVSVPAWTTLFIEWYTSCSIQHRTCQRFTHTVTRTAAELPGPQCIVSSLESNFLVSWDWKLAKAQESDTGLWWCLAFISPRWRLQQMMRISSLSGQIVVTCRNNYHSVTSYCICFNP